MKLLREATRRLLSCVSPRALIFAVTALIGVLLPTAAFAGEADVMLDFGESGPTYLGISLGFGVVAILFAIWISRGVMAMSPGSANMQAVGQAIREGPLA